MASAASAMIVLMASTGCAPRVLRPSCRAGESAVVNDALYFGTARPTGKVTPKEWAEFLDREIAPRLPIGFTSWEAKGQSQNAAGTVAREASHVVLVIHPDDEASERSIAAIMNTYRKRFDQDAVLRIRTNACSSTMG